MSYLDRYLRHNRGQVVSCNDLYVFLLKVKHQKTLIQQITIAENDLSISLIVKGILPDVDDWQYAGENNGYYLFRFHNPAHRTLVAAQFSYLGYPTISRNFIPS